MNLILITKDEKEQGLQSDDPRVIHIKSILKKEIGSSVLLGVEGEITLWQTEISENNGKIFFINPSAVGKSPKNLNLSLVLGLSRPLVMKRLLKDISSLGVKNLHLVRTELGEKSYLQSSLWQGEHLKLLREGAIQARSTYLPQIFLHESAKDLFSFLEKDLNPQRWILHLDKEAPHLLKQEVSKEGVILAIGSERGWTEKESLLFQSEGFQILSMGRRVLRTETATLASVYWLSEKLNLSSI